MSRTAMSRTTLTATALVLSLGLTACGGGDEKQVSADAKQTLTVWAMGEEGNRVAEIAKTFNKEHPGITVKVTPVGWDVAHQKLVSAAAADQLPDMAQLGSTWVGEFIELGALEPVDTEVFEEKDFFPAAWQGNEKDGEVYGVPWYVDTRVLYYRTDLAKKAGVQGEPKTWADQLKLAEGYKKLDSTKWAFSLPAGGDGAWQNWLPYLFQAGGTLVDKDGRPTLDSPESVKALTEYAKYFDKGLARGTRPTPGYDVIKDFGADKVPMFASGPWMVQNIEDQVPKVADQYETVPLPSGAKQGNIIGGASLVTFAGSEHKAAAQEFTKFLTDAKTQAKWYEMAKSLPANQNAWNEPQLKKADVEDFKASLDAAQAIPPIAKWEEIAHQIDLTLEKLAKGGDPAKLAAELQKNAESLVS
ncbi:sugar ABC transporter substrate-binding protein [Streptomyces luteolus]|uniref:Sugar ABC transporter substrate-binding protein n=1 Tax=Streptomyces luteolus TaxID=3043615 RepID=A0ABT6T0X7_9ACTN|nr:sugar ABC transporter substrate-binding protein [Streptomyces sp. B-S-A12]MDI3421105.1 sugar ABC transporter substrate-binding protein [Streptomyces sp. B-S-A12]